MRWKRALWLWTILVLTVTLAAKAESKNKKENTESNKDIYVIADFQNEDPGVGSGSGSNFDIDTNASGIGPDDEDGNKEGSGSAVSQKPPPAVSTATVRTLLPCQQQRISYANSPNVFIPECEKNGEYKRMQCMRDNHVCWCVLKDGSRAEGTEKHGDMSNPREAPACTTGTNIEQCIKQVLEQSWNSDHLLGAPTLACDKHGKFKAMQCYETECYCVDEYGKTIPKTGKIHPEKPNCDDIRAQAKSTRQPAKPLPEKESSTDDIDIDEEIKSQSRNNGIDVEIPGDLDVELEDKDVIDNSHKYDANRQKLPTKVIPLIDQPGILAGIIGGAVVGLLCAVLLIMFIVYRVRKKDEGSYALDEPTKARGAYAYQKAPDKEFYA